MLCFVSECFQPPLFLEWCDTIPVIPYISVKPSSVCKYEEPCLLNVSSVLSYQPPIYHFDEKGQFSFSLFSCIFFTFICYILQFNLCYNLLYISIQFML